MAAVIAAVVAAALNFGGLVTNPWVPANEAQSQMMGRADCEVIEGTTIATGLVARCPARG